MRDFYIQNKNAIQDFLLLSGTILICFLFFRYLFPILLPFFVGWLISLIFRPLAAFLERHKVPAWIASLCCILLLLGAISLFVGLIGNRIAEQAKSFFVELPSYLQSIEGAADRFWAHFDEISSTLPTIVQTLVDKIRENIVAVIMPLVKKGSSSLTGVPKFFLGALIALFSSYFFTKDREAIHRVFENNVSPLLGSSMNRTKKQLKASIWGYVKTQLILMGYTFVICIIGLYVLHSPFALLLSFIIAIIDSLPFFGSGFILWPGAVIHLILGDMRLCIGYLIIYVAVQIMRQIMQPKILGTQIGLHPLLTLFSMYFGYKCVGFWGLILGPFIAVLLRAYFAARQEEAEEDADSLEGQILE